MRRSPGEPCAELGEEDVPVDLPGPWGALLKDGQVLTALLLSTSFSEKYKGRHLFPARDGQPLQAVDLRLVASGSSTRTIKPKLLHRSGNREAVAFIWLGDHDVGDRTLYVAFSPMRYRSQFFKIYCAGMVENAVDTATPSEETSCPEAGEGRGGGRVLNISAYVHGKLQRLWGQQGLWDNLVKSCKQYPDHRVVFAGISHGAALAQAAALQFRIRISGPDIFVVTWNAYRWTDEAGRRLAEAQLGDRLLPFVLSRRSGNLPQATRYWDSVTGFPAGYTGMPNPILLDADSGVFFKHSAPAKTSTSTMGAAFWMRAFELHFAKFAITATKKATAASLGTPSDDDQSEDCPYLVAPLTEKLQERVIETSERMVQKGSMLKQRTKDMLQGAGNSYARLPSGRAKSEQAKQPGRRRAPWWGRLAWCGCR